MGFEALFGRVPVADVEPVEAELGQTAGDERGEERPGRQEHGPLAAEHRIPHPVPTPRLADGNERHGSLPHARVAP